MLYNIGTDISTELNSTAKLVKELTGSCSCRLKKTRKELSFRPKYELKTAIKKCRRRERGERCTMNSYTDLNIPKFGFSDRIISI